MHIVNSRISTTKVHKEVADILTKERKWNYIKIAKGKKRMGDQKIRTKNRENK